MSGLNNAFLQPLALVNTAMESITREWRNRVRAEYKSAATTAQVVHWMIQVGAPEALLHVALRIVRDELDHAKLSHEALLVLGGEARPTGFEAADLALSPSDDGILASLLDVIVQCFCLGETFAVPLFSEMRQKASHPAVLPMLTRVLQDEAVHRAFGWNTLDYLLELEPAGVRQRISQRLPQWIGEYQSAYAHSPDHRELTAQERAAGLLCGAEYARIFHETVRHTVGPWFQQRQIQLVEF